MRFYEAVDFPGGNYWNKLEQMRAVAKRHDLPFWNIVLACAHFNFREPTQADLRFEVYSSLAYGACGIAYFMYFMRRHHCGNYRAAAIDQPAIPRPPGTICKTSTCKSKRSRPPCCN